MPEPDVPGGMEVTKLRLVVGPDGRVRIPAFSLESYVVVGAESLEEMLTAAYQLGLEKDD